MKIHFGTGNDSAEDYYYVNIGDATLDGLGLTNTTSKRISGAGDGPNTVTRSWEGSFIDSGITRPTGNDYPNTWESVRKPVDHIADIQTLLPKSDTWYNFLPNDPAIVQENNPMFILPKGSKNVVIDMYGGVGLDTKPGATLWVDNDINVFTASGKHLVGTPLDDYVFNYDTWPIKWGEKTGIDDNSHLLGFTSADYDDSCLNSGPGTYDPGMDNFKFTTYNGMTFGYSGDPDRHETTPNDGRPREMEDHEILLIDEVTEDLIIWFPGQNSHIVKYHGYIAPYTPTYADESAIISIGTQELAQQALTRIDNAIIKKDKIRAHLGALQNRFENTASNLRIQAENMQAAESRISDADVSLEMTEFARSQILTQTATAMLAQANSLPKMLMRLLEG